MSTERLSRKDFFKLGGLVAFTVSGCSGVIETVASKLTPGITAIPGSTETPFQPELPTVTLTPEPTQNPTSAPTETATPESVSCSLEKIITEIKEKGLQEVNTIPVLTITDYRKNLEGKVDLSSLKLQFLTELTEISATATEMVKKVVLPEYVKPSDVSGTKLTFEVESYKPGMDLTGDGTFLAAVHVGKNGLTTAFWQMPVLEKRSDGTDKVNGVLYVFGKDSDGSRVFAPAPNQRFIDQKYKRTYPDIAVTNCSGAVVRVETGTDYDATYVLNPEGNIVDNQNVWIPLQNLRPYESEYNVVTEKETVNAAELDPNTRLLIVYNPDTGKYDVKRSGVYNFEWNKWGRVLSASNERGDNVDAYLFSKKADQKLGWAGIEIERLTYLENSATSKLMNINALFTGNIKEFYNLRINGTLYNYHASLEFLFPTTQSEFTPYYLPSSSYYIREGTVKAGTQKIGNSFYEFSSAIKTLQEMTDSKCLISLGLCIERTGSFDEWFEILGKDQWNHGGDLGIYSSYDFQKEYKANEIENNRWPECGSFLLFGYMIK